MGCSCISEVNKRLSEHNACLVTTLFADPERPTLAVDKVNSRKRGRLPHMVASFCPFCGARYEPVKAEDR